MQSMMGTIGKQAGFLQRMPGMKQLAMANRLKDAVRTGGLEGNPMMANIADQLLEAAVAGGGGPSGLPAGLMRQLGGMAPASGTSGGRHSKLSAEKRKAMRKQQKKARQKSRR
jgi:hypothetical protein